MEFIAGTALLAFGGGLCARRARAVGLLRWALRLTALTALVLGLPAGLTAGAIGVGWALSLFDRWRGIGWDIFAAGCASFGRDLLAQTAPAALPALAGAFWSLGWATAGRAPWGARRDWRGLRLELLRARRAMTPQRPDDAWRVRAADALDRALALARPSTTVGRPGGAPRDALLRLVGDRLAQGAAALAEGDLAGARERFAGARRAAVSAERHRFPASEETRRWLELIDWCEIATALIDEEARQ